MSDITNFTEITDGLDPDDIIYAGRPSDTGNADKNTKKKNMLLKGIHLNSNRIALQELPSGTLSVSGYYTIMIGNANTSASVNADIVVMSDGNKSLGCHLAFTPSSSTKTHMNTTIKLFGNGYDGSGVNDNVQGFRLAKSDSLSGAGWKLQVKLGSSLTPTIQMIRNLGRSNNALGVGGILVTPYLDNTPTLPDGVTVGTFLEAGEEIDISNIGVFSPFISAKYVTNDALACIAHMPFILKQGTVVTISNPTSVKINDGVGNQADLGAHTISNIIISGNRLQFQINQTGFATAIPANTPAWFRTTTGSTPVIIIT